MNTHNEEELEIDLKELWYAIRHRILLILAAGPVSYTHLRSAVRFY